MRRRNTSLTRLSFAAEVVVDRGDVDVGAAGDSRSEVPAMLGETVPAAPRDPVLGRELGRPCPASRIKRLFDRRNTRASDPGKRNRRRDAKPAGKPELLQPCQLKPRPHAGFSVILGFGRSTAARPTPRDPLSWRLSAPFRSSSPMPSPRTSSAKSIRVSRRPASGRRREDEATLAKEAEGFPPCTANARSSARWSNFMISGPVMVQVLEGENAVAEEPRTDGRPIRRTRPRHDPRRFRRQHRRERGARFGLVGERGDRDRVLLQATDVYRAVPRAPRPSTWRAKNARFRRERPASPTPVGKNEHLRFRPRFAERFFEENLGRSASARHR